MGQKSLEEFRRGLLRTVARRGLVLAALGTGLWLTGQATATADEGDLAPTTAPTSSLVDTLAAPSELVRSAASTAAPVAGGTLSSVVPMTTPAVPAPVVPVPVVTALADPSLQAVERVVEAVEPVQDVVVPLVDAIRPTVPPAVRAPVSPPVAPELVPGQVADGAHLLPDAGPVATRQRPDTGSQDRDEVVPVSALDLAGAQPTPASAVDAAVLADGDEPAGVPGPAAPRPAAENGPPRAVTTAGHSFDQSAAVLSAVIPATVTAALAATDHARDAVADVCPDPSFAPD